MRRIPLIAAALLAAAAAAHAQQPSFDCRAATTPVERLTCTTPRLAELDVSLAAAYRDHLAAARTPADRESRTADQRRWLAVRAPACPMVATAGEGTRHLAADCLARLTESRIARITLDRNRAAWPRTPFLPRLVRGAGTPLCEALARDLEASFRSPSVTVNPLGEREIAFSPLPRAPDDLILSATMDLYGTNRPVIVLRIEEEGGPRRVSTVAFRVHPASLLDRLARGAPATDLTDTGRPLMDVAALEARPVPPRESIPTISTDPRHAVPDVPRFFRDGTRTRLLSPAIGPVGIGGDLGAYALTGPTSRPRELCLFVTDAPDLSLGDAALYTRPEITAVLAAVAPLLPASTCGSRDEDRRTLSERAALRPWSVRPIPATPGQVGTAQLAPYLRARALSSVAAHRRHAAYQGARHAAIRTTATYYRDRFARPAAEAEERAALYVDRLRADSLEVYPEDPGAALLNPAYVERRAVRAAILSGNLDALRAALDADPALARRPPEHPWEDPLLALAAPHPDIVRALIERGAGIEAVGGSGRTPLLLAAELGATESAAILIQAGADPNALTIPPLGPDPTEDACVGAADPLTDPTSGRSALSLAAARADALLVRLLLDAGTDPATPDAAGRRPLDHARDPAVRDLLPAPVRDRR